MCDWFVMCDNPAEGAVEHPVLGTLGICRRCAEHVGMPDAEVIWAEGSES